MNQEQNIVNLDTVLELNTVGEKVLERTATQLFFIRATAYKLTQKSVTIPGFSGYCPPWH